ncbi:MAG: Ig-like domain-containing protein [Anaerolineaceae bacterium]|nr:Ig-like domain-containing protein [Anaerolineaceae bacterium]
MKKVFYLFVVFAVLMTSASVLAYQSELPNSCEGIEDYAEYLRCDFLLNKKNNINSQIWPYSRCELIAPGESKTAALDSNEENKIYWNSSDTAVVSVSDDGVISALTLGTAEISAVDENCSTVFLSKIFSTGKNADDCNKITGEEYRDLLKCRYLLEAYKKEKNQFISPITELADIQLKKSKIIYLGPGKTDGMTWESSDPEIIEVSENGVVTALDYGLATVKGYNSNGKEIFSVNIRCDEISFLVEKYQLEEELSPVR